MPFIIIGGWNIFAEYSGVNQKEPVETFEWISNSSDRFFYEDCRDALIKVDGAKEWLKNYTYNKKESRLQFNSGLGIQIELSHNHSGASHSSILWSYKHLLNDWNSWVYKSKRYSGMRAYKEQQISLSNVLDLLSQCDKWVSYDGVGHEALLIENAIKAKWSSFELKGEVLEDVTILKIQTILKQIQNDWLMIRAEEDAKQIERSHSEMIDSLEFLYENPSRWFDSKYGCSLTPGHPKNIPPRAMDDMDAAYPGYKGHIANIINNFNMFSQLFNDPVVNGNYSERAKIINTIMTESGIVAGCIN